MKKRMVAGLTLLVAPLLILPAAAAAGDTESNAPATLEQVLERYVDTVGGRAAIERLTTRTCTGRLVDNRPYRGPLQVSPFEIWAKIPGKYLIIRQEPDGTSAEGFDGTIGWKERAGERERDDSLGRTKHAWLFDPQGALRLEEYFPGMVLRRREMSGEPPVYVVETGRDPAHYALHFDAESGLLIRIGHYWDLRDYREVDGIRIPFRVVMSRKGGSTTYIFDEVKHNVPVDDARLATPSD